MEKNQRIEELLMKHLKGELIEQEQNELDDWVNEAEQHKALYDRITNDEQLAQRVAEQVEVKRTIWHKITTGIPELRTRIIFHNWRRFSAAAAIIIGVLIGGYFWFNSSKQRNVAITTTTKNNNDVKPGTEKAVLTLADGSKIALDNTSNGAIAQQGNTVVMKEDGLLAYNVDQAKSQKEILYNTLTTARGEEYKSLVLADGTKVWLNSVSSIHFPTSFITNERIVEIAGEVYFEVAKNLSKPFKVKVNGMQVEVLGTHFNINAYGDEAIIKTTLLEGSVKVVNGNSLVKITPGQQAQVSKNGNIKVESNVDVDEVTAWKNGRFQFSGAGIEEVMRQISRWYDVDVVYEGKPKEQHFRGGISRNVDASKILKMLETTEAIKFRIEGKKVIVIP